MKKTWCLTIILMFFMLIIIILVLVIIFLKIRPIIGISLINKQTFYQIIYQDKEFHQEQIMINNL